MAKTTQGKSIVPEQHRDPITAEEIEGTSQPQASNTTSTTKRTNACTLSTSLPHGSTKAHDAVAELMSSKKPKSSTEPVELPAKPKMRGFDPRDGLGIYIEHPEKNPEGLVVEYDDDFVVIKDKFPKASVHLLLIPRKPEYHYQHPLHFLSSNPTFLAEVRKRVERLKLLAASELRRKYGHHSASDAPYQAALEDLMSQLDPPQASERDALLPPGRDWLSEIRAGAHTHPSMNHMHVHIMSREMHSPCLKHKKHYLSFHSSFFVEVDEFPLAEGSARFHPGKWPNWDMKCWRCEENFQNKFAKLKGHLEEEFEAWKKE
ncbi:HIT-like domain-containing protein [Boeremia exigua]|uniref:HIT-like domain-containing protein n=1 Tax=Boeremia exigua TaxID=749465 RepID=UPI001E8E4C06|nr:HIT-like domain-containing protein [Boeremia exigua]KAH6642317.1 HIT-like domain-containing protein [Boeremia exigua]